MPGAAGNGEFMATILSMLAELRRETQQGAIQVEICKAMLKEHEKNQQEHERNQREFDRNQKDSRRAHQETAQTLRLIQERLMAMEKRQAKADERLRKGAEADLVLTESLRHLTAFIQTVGKEVEGLKSRVDTLESR